MTPRHLLLAGAVALVVSACGQPPAPPQPAAAPAETATPAAEGTASPAAETGAVDTVSPAEASPAPAAGTRPARVADCATTLESNDAMQYDADSIVIPAACSFTIHLRHVGVLPVGAMGHNVVIARQADMAAIAADGMTVVPEHLKPDDPRVIAHTAMIGGGGSTSVRFDVARLAKGGPYRFFCSFPGHLALMQGSLLVQ
jgi:azurin